VHDMLSAVARRTAIPAVLAALALIASAACSPSSADKATSDPTIATEPAPTTTTNPYAVPAVIDTAYVNRVLAGLDAQIGDVTRMVVRTGTIPPEAYDRLKAIYADAGFLQIAIDGFQQDIREQFKGYKPNPGNKVTFATQLITSRRDCIFAQVQRDYSAIGSQPSPSLTVQWIGLTPLDPTRDPANFNLTSWALIYDGFPPSHTQPRNPCGN
jgi:hypothetical protein